MDINDITTKFDTNVHFWKSIGVDDSKCKDIEECSTNSKAKECYELEICNNKVYSDTLVSVQGHQSSSHGRYNDSANKNRLLLLNNLNLGVGIMGIMSFIVFGL